MYWLPAIHGRPLPLGSWPIVIYWEICNVADMLSDCVVQEVKTTPPTRTKSHFGDPNYSGPAQTREVVIYCIAEVRMHVCCARILEDSAGNRDHFCAPAIFLPNHVPPSSWEHFVAVAALRI